jgi:hypothetical protein
VKSVCISFSPFPLSRRRRRCQIPNPPRSERVGDRRRRRKMVKVATYFAMTFGAFLFWQSMDRVHVWIALHQDEKKERMEREQEIKRMQAELMAQAKESES